MFTKEIFKLNNESTSISFTHDKHMYIHGHVTILDTEYKVKALFDFDDSFAEIQANNDSYVHFSMPSASETGLYRKIANKLSEIRNNARNAIENTTKDEKAFLRKARNENLDIYIDATVPECTNVTIIANKYNCPALKNYHGYIEIHLKLGRNSYKSAYYMRKDKDKYFEHAINPNIFMTAGITGMINEAGMCPTCQKKHNPDEMYTYGFAGRICPTCHRKGYK